MKWGKRNRNSYSYSLCPNLDGYSYNSSNDPTVYFTFLGANADKTQHVKMLGDNVFGFEDLSGGGDKDYNDVIVKINLTHNIA